MHIAKMHKFSKFSPPHFSLCFLPSAARSLKRTKKHVDRNWVFRSSWPILRLSEVEISVQVMYHKTAGFTTCCLSLWCCRCLWRVSSSRSCCDNFLQQRAFFIKRCSKFVVFFILMSSLLPPLPSLSPLSFYTTICRKNEIRMPGTQGQQGAGHPVHMYIYIYYIEIYFNTVCH